MYVYFHAWSNTKRELLPKEALVSYCVFVAIAIKYFSRLMLNNYDYLSFCDCCVHSDDSLHFFISLYQGTLRRINFVKINVS